jgi:hypothetical protein
MQQPLSKFPDVATTPSAGVSIRYRAILDRPETAALFTRGTTGPHRSSRMLTGEHSERRPSATTCRRALAALLPPGKAAGRGAQGRGPAVGGSQIAKRDGLSGGRGGTCGMRPRASTASPHLAEVARKKFTLAITCAPGMAMIVGYAITRAFYLSTVPAF